MGQVYLFGQCLVSGIQGDVDSFLNACRMLHIFWTANAVVSC